MSRALILALSFALCGQVVKAQAIEVSAGSSSLFGGTGGSATVYFPTHTMYLGGGLGQGRAIVGLSDSFNFHGYGVTLGDKLFGFAFDGTGLAVVNRGVTFERRSESEQLTAFVGSTGFGYYTPFFQGNTPRNFGAGLFLQKRIGKLHVSSLEVLDGNKKTASEGFSYQQRVFRLAGSGGVLNNARFLNAQADFEPARWIHFAAVHQNYFWPQRSTFNNLSAFTSLGHFSVQASALDGSTFGRKITGWSAGAGFQFRAFSEHTDFYRSNEQRFVTHSLMENFRRISLSQGITISSGKPSAAFGGSFHTNSISVSVGHSVLFFVFNGRGFQQVTSIQLSFRVPHTDASVNLGVNVGLEGTPRYTAYSTDYFYGHSSLFSGAAQPRGIGKFVVRGVVLDTENRPVEGAALQIGKTVLFTDSAGAFTLRSRKRDRLPLVVLTAEFEVGNWEVMDAPAFVTIETEGPPVRISVRRKQP